MNCFYYKLDGIVFELDNILSQSFKTRRACVRLTAPSQVSKVDVGTEFIARVTDVQLWSTIRVIRKS